MLGVSPDAEIGELASAYRRRLRQLHPEVKIKIFYQRDYLALLVKYGLEPPSQDLPVDDGVEPLPLRFD